MGLRDELLDVVGGSEWNGCDLSNDLRGPLKGGARQPSTKATTQAEATEVLVLPSKREQDAHAARERFEGG